MPRSIVVDLRKALVSGLSAREGLADVQVSYGWPGDDVVETESIYLNRPRGSHKPANLRAGRVHRDEAATLDIVIRVEKRGGTSEEADERALELGTEVEEYLADNADSLDVTGLLWIVVEGWELWNGYNDTGRLSELTYTLRWQARLT